MDEDLWGKTGTSTEEAESTQADEGVEETKEETTAEDTTGKQTDESPEALKERIAALEKSLADETELRKRHEGFNSKLGPELKAIKKEIADLKAGGTQRQIAADVKYQTDLANLQAQRDTIDPTEFNQKKLEIDKRHDQATNAVEYATYAQKHVQNVLTLLDAAGIAYEGGSVDPAVVELYNAMNAAGEKGLPMEDFYNRAATLIATGVGKTKATQQTAEGTEEEKNEKKKQELAKMNTKGGSGGGSGGSDLEFIERYGAEDYEPTPEDHLRAAKIRQRRDSGQ